MKFIPRWLGGIWITYCAWTTLEKASDSIYPTAAFFLALLLFSAIDKAAGQKRAGGGSGTPPA